MKAEKVENILAAVKALFDIVAPLIKKLIESTVVPMLKRKAYEKLNDKADSMIEDLAQNAAKIANEPDKNKKAAFAEGTKLGIETLRAIADKMIKAADEIEKVL